MFTWNVEEQKLRKNQYTIGRTKLYDCESSTSREDKITFVDSMQDGKLSYILSLSEKLEGDKDKMPKDNYGNIKTVSLKAWIKKNDTKYSRPVIDTEYKYGSFYICGVERNICYINSKRRFDYYSDLVDEVFHHQLTKCEEKEEEYFHSHNPYSVAKFTLKNYMEKYSTTFGVDISYGSSGIWIKDENNRDNEREITIEECNELIEKYKMLDSLVEKITNETNIKY